MATYKVHVFINPLEGRDAEFNEWYDAEHVPDVLALPGFVRAERFAVHPLGDESMRYLNRLRAGRGHPGRSARTHPRRAAHVPAL
jgi:hypothetical protein